MRVQDLSFTAKHRVEDSFRKDLIASTRQRFGTERVHVDQHPIDALPKNKVDITVSHPSGSRIAIYPATSNQKALEAVLLSSRSR